MPPASCSSDGVVYRRVKSFVSVVSHACVGVHMWLAMHARVPCGRAARRLLLHHHAAARCSSDRVAYTQRLFTRLVIKYARSAARACEQGCASYCGAQAAAVSAPAAPPAARQLPALRRRRGRPRATAAPPIHPPRIRPEAAIPTPVAEPGRGEYRASSASPHVLSIASLRTLRQGHCCDWAADAS